MQQPPGHHLAELNIGRVKYELDDPRMADFTDNLELVNGLAERSPGFVWRYVDDSGNATDTRPFADPLVIVNVSVWETVAALEHFVWQTLHKRFYGRRVDWSSISRDRRSRCGGCRPATGPAWKRRSRGWHI